MDESSVYLKQKHEEYQKKIDFRISFEEFSRPKTFIELHEKLVGTVIHEINEQLRCYEHLQYFGCMLFYSRLTDDQITNGPLIWEDLQGNACCL